MNAIKKIFTAATGYWLHKIDSLPVGSDLFVDIHRRMSYPALSTMFDVGANLGQTLHWFHFNEPSAMVYCFEPVKETFNSLSANAAQGKKYKLENFALGETAGTKTIRLFDDYTVLNSLKDDLLNNNTNAKEEIIKIDTVDSYCKANDIQKIDLLKIDTEGYEMNVLEGAKEVLEKGSVSFIYCEVGFMKKNIRNTYFPILTEWLAEKNYYFFGMYQMDTHDWEAGNYLGNALYVHKSLFKN